MGNCMICPEEREEADFEPRSFCHIEDRGVSKQFLQGMADLIENNEDDGKDRPGDVHVPTESEKFKFVEDFPHIIRAMHSRMVEMLGPWKEDPSRRVDS